MYFGNLAMIGKLKFLSALLSVVLVVVVGEEVNLSEEKCAKVQMGQQTVIRFIIVSVLLAHVMCCNEFTKLSLIWLQAGVLTYVSQLNNAMGYAGLDGVVGFEGYNDTGSPCRIKVAKMINKAGEVVVPSVESAQSCFTTVSALGTECALTL